MNKNNDESQTLKTPPSMPKERPTPEPIDISLAMAKALETSIESVSPGFKKNQMSEDEVNKVIITIANIHNMPPAFVIIGVILLFLKGAASGTPLSLSVEVSEFELSKRDLLNAYTAVTVNNFLRRMAEAMAMPIGQYAERNRLRGELAQKVENSLKAETGERLTAKELAWCSSFNQHLENLSDLSSERLVKLLSADNNKRFVENKTKQKEEKKSVPQAKRGNKKNPKQNK